MQSSWRWLAVCLAAALPPFAAGAVVDPALDTALADAPAGQRLPVTVILAEQVDHEELARVAAGAGGRARAVDRLRRVATSSQQALVAALGLDARAGAVHSLWLVNALSLEATPEMIRRLAERREVARLLLDRPREVFLDRYPGYATGVDIPPGGSIDWGVERAGVPEVEARWGITGRGAVVAVIDTGVCLEHPDLAGRIWVNPGEDLDGDGVVRDPDDLNGIDDDGNGLVDDLVGWDFDADDNDPDDTLSGHGSHVAGTVAGDGRRGHRAGMASGARVMAVRVGTRSTRQSSVWRGMEYAAAAGADVINLSLGWAHAWNPDRRTWRAISERLAALGVVLVAAAGNEGAGREPDNVRTPADVPGVIAVGAIDADGRVADFSSRGPVSWSEVPGYGDHPWPPGLAKPEVAAAGVETRSHMFCRGYDDRSGTSMAAPHVSGLVALLLEADPFLSPAEVRRILARSSRPAGEGSGAGEIDAVAAVGSARRPLLERGVEIDDRQAGNGDGALDPGETALLYVTLENAGERVLGPERVRLVPTTPGTRVEVGEARYPRLEPGGRARVSFRVAFELPCGARAGFRVEAETGGERPSRSAFEVLVGSERRELIFADDFETPGAWSVAGDAAAGAWERARPRGVREAGRWTAPERAASGQWAWVTGNAGSTPLDDDVDRGRTLLLSPWLEVGGFEGMELTYRRWFSRQSGPASWPPRAWFRGEVEEGDGRRVTFDLPPEGEGGWQSVRVPLEPPRGGRLRLRFTVGEDDPLGGDRLAEGGLDALRLEGLRVVCDGP